MNWANEQERFMAVAYDRTLDAARKAFRHWRSWKRDDAVAERVAKVWATWTYNLAKGKDPVALLGPNLRWAILWVRYDRRIAGRARSFDVYDHRARMKRQDLDAQGRPHPSERSARENGWINWRSVMTDDDPAEWAAAKDELGL